MTVETIMKELESKGNASIKKILVKHGILEPFFGVKVEDLKVIQKKIKKDYHLSKGLYATGNADAMYLAGLIADEQSMTRKDLAGWASHAHSTNIYTYTVPWIAAESQHGMELALEWIKSKEEHIAVAGWSTLSNLVAIKADADLDIKSLKALLAEASNSIHKVEGKVALAMNSFVIAVGTHVVPLTEHAMGIAKKIGLVKVNMGDTACKVPDALTYINKAKDTGTTGKKKKMARC